jgi:hypothetical protein
MFEIPRPKGEGCQKGRVRGEEKNCFTPHLVLRTTLSLRARDLFQNVFYFTGIASGHLSATSNVLPSGTIRRRPLPARPSRGS